MSSHLFLALRGHADDGSGVVKRNRHLSNSKVCRWSFEHGRLIVDRWKELRRSPEKKRKADTCA